MKKIGKIILWVLAVILGLFLLLALWNGICTAVEKSHKKNAYGSYAPVHGLNMCYSVEGKSNNTTVVILPGLGSASPILEFLPVSKSLSEKYRVITLEPFGYGISDYANTDRTAKNVAEEIHEALKTIKAEYGFDSYYIVAHSLGGVYSLQYANMYGEELLGFIGIDSSVPEMNNYNPLPVSVTKLNIFVTILNKFLNLTGIPRLKSLSNKQSVVFCDRTYQYSEKEIEIFRSLSLTEVYNKTAKNELNHLDSNLELVEGLKFPKNVRVLQMVSSSNCSLIEQWPQLHGAIIENEETKNNVLVVKGGHYLHITSKDELLNLCFDFIK